MRRPRPRPSPRADTTVSGRWCRLTTTSRTPARRRRRSVQCRSGRLSTGSTGFARSSVNGRMRRPKPAASTIAFVVDRECNVIAAGSAEGYHAPSACGTVAKPSQPARLAPGAQGPHSAAMFYVIRVKRLAGAGLAGGSDPPLGATRSSAASTTCSRRWSPFYAAVERARATLVPRPSTGPGAGCWRALPPTTPAPRTPCRPRRRRRRRDRRTTPRRSRWPRSPARPATAAMPSRSPSISTNAPIGVSSTSTDWPRWRKLSRYFWYRKIGRYPSRLRISSRAEGSATGGLAAPRATSPPPRPGAGP